MAKTAPTMYRVTLVHSINNREEEVRSYLTVARDSAEALAAVGAVAETYVGQEVLMVEAVNKPVKVATFKRPKPSGPSSTYRRD